MQKAILTVLLFLLYQHIFSQLKDQALSIPDNLISSTNGISSYINEHFTTDTARARAIFVWVASNIGYDITAFQNRSALPQTVSEVLKTRVALCGGYAELFHELCTRCDIRSMVINGYVKQKGAVSRLSHAWVAAELDHAWWMFDPTWGAGYINDDNFTKSYSTKYYKLSPGHMITDHMPFDPLYQLLDHTVSNKEFIEGKTTVNTTKPFFNFADTLQRLNLLSRDDKIRNELRRTQNNGIENEIILDRVRYLQKLTESFLLKGSYELAIDFYKRAILLFNDYIAYKNKRFTPAIEDKEIKTMIDSVSYHTNACYNALSTVIARDEANRQAISSTYRELEKFQSKVNQEKDFVAAYVRASREERERMFLRR